MDFESLFFIIFAIENRIEPWLNDEIVMEQKLKTKFYAMGAMILAPQTLSAQSVNIEGLDSLRLSGSVSVVEPELLRRESPTTTCITIT